MRSTSRRAARGGVQAPERREPARGQPQRALGASNQTLLRAQHTRRALGEGGAPLDRSTRAPFEQAFGHDFHDVRIHTGRDAAVSAAHADARAYTVGRDIVFGAGRFAPGTAAGQQLLRHELTHVVQQHGRTPTLQRQTLTPEERTSSPPSAAAPPSAGQQVDFDLEVPPPAEREALRQRGVELPQVSRAAADPRQHSDYIDRRVNAVGFGLYLGGFLVYCDGLPLPILVPDSYIDFGLTSVDASDVSIYPDHDAAARAVPIGPPAEGRPLRTTTFYRGGGGALVVPTIFSPATTPRVIETALRARQTWVQDVQNELIVLAASIVGGMVIRAVINRLARIGTRGSTTPRAVVPPGTGAAFGRQIAQEMRAADFRGNPFREIMRRLNARPQRLPPDEAAEAIAVAAREFTAGNMGTMPPIQQGTVLVVPSRAPIPNAPVMGVRSDGTVIMGRAPRIEIVRNAQGVPVLPPQARIIGEVVWE